MTDLIDRADSGEIPRYDSLGDDPTRNLRAERDAILASQHHLRLSDPTCEIPVVEDEPTMRQHLAAGFDEPVPTERLSLLDSLTGPQAPPAPDPLPVPPPPSALATPPASPPPPPPPPRPAVPGKFLERVRYVGRHREARAEHPYRGLVWFVVLAVAVTAFGMWQVRG